jgi:hypothetical protein
MEKDAFAIPFKAMPGILLRAIRHPNLTTRAFQASHGTKRVVNQSKNFFGAMKDPSTSKFFNERALNRYQKKHRIQDLAQATKGFEKEVRSKELFNTMPKILKGADKTFVAGRDLFNRLTGQPHIQTGLERFGSRAGKAAKNTAIGVAGAAGLGAAGLAYGTMNRPPTSDFTAMSGY